jgi:hypothetical protein
MRWFGGLIIVACLLLAGCDRRCTGPDCTALDYVDFVRLGGITYNAVDLQVGRRARSSDLGPVLAHVRRKLSDNEVITPIKDGDAAFLAVGTPVYSVKGYRPSFRVAAGRDALRFFEADQVPGARTGADLFDLVGKVRYIGINSDFDGRTELAAIKDRKQVAMLVHAVLDAPVRSGPPTEGESCIIAFHLADGTAVNRALHLGTGWLAPGVSTPRQFPLAVEATLQARNKRCSDTR